MLKRINEILKEINVELTYEDFNALKTALKEYISEFEEECCIKCKPTLEKIESIMEYESNEVYEKYLEKNKG